MKRRNFLKGLMAIPVVAVAPKLLSSEIEEAPWLRNEADMINEYNLKPFFKPVENYGETIKWDGEIGSVSNFNVYNPNVTAHDCEFTGATEINGGRYYGCTFKDVKTIKNAYLEDCIIDNVDIFDNVIIEGSIRCDTFTPMINMTGNLI